MKTPVFIDCDPGLDDLVALLAAFKMPEIEVVGAASVCGNVALEHTARNLASILEMAGQTRLPFASGAAAPLVRKYSNAAYIHGETGTGSQILPVASLRPAPVPAHTLLAGLAQQYSGQLVVVALGPLTNIAKAFMATPGLVGHIKQIVLMGGAHCHGNITPAAEFNIYCDAEAANIVFNAGVPITMVGLDVTMAVPLPAEKVDTVCNTQNPAGAVMRQALLDICANTEKFGQGYNAHIHDLMAVVCAAHPEWFTLQHCRVDIETKGEFTYGQTVCDLAGTSGQPANAWVALGVDKNAYLPYVKEIMRSI